MTISTCATTGHPAMALVLRATPDVLQDQATYPTYPGQARRVRITDDHQSSALVPRWTMPLKPGACKTAQRGEFLLLPTNHIL